MVVEARRDTSSLDGEQLVPLRLTQSQVEVLQPDDHFSLPVVEAGVVDRDCDLVGERREQAFVGCLVAARPVGDADHPDHARAHTQRHPEEGVEDRVAGRGPDPQRVVLDVIRDVWPLLDDRHAKHARPNRYRLEPFVKTWVRRLEALDGNDLHVDRAFVEQTDEPHL